MNANAQEVMTAAQQTKNAQAEASITFGKLMRKASKEEAAWNRVADQMIARIKELTDSVIESFFQKCPHEDIREKLASRILDELLSLYEPREVLDQRRSGRRPHYKPHNLCMMHWVLTGAEYLSPTAAFGIMKKLQGGLVLSSCVQRRFSAMQRIIADLELTPDCPIARQQAAAEFRLLRKR